MEEIAVAYGESEDDVPYLCVRRREGATFKYIKSIEGERAKEIYKALTERAGEEDGSNS